MTARQQDIESDGGIEAFRLGARRWLGEQAGRKAPRAEQVWGEGPDKVGVYPGKSDEVLGEELVAEREWQARKMVAGYGAISWPPQFGGRGLSLDHEMAFEAEEAEFEVPAPQETLRTSLKYVAPVVREFGTEEQRHDVVPRFLNADVVSCLLLSEPGSGSDLASVSTRAEPDGGEWTIVGQKVWTSGARLCDVGIALCRSSAREAGRKGLTAFLVPLDAPGVEVRPLRQMTGHSFFNEVFFEDVVVADSQRLGEVGQGWTVIMSVMAFDRGDAGKGGSELANRAARLVELARRLGRDRDPNVRQELARLYGEVEILRCSMQRVRDAEASGTPGPGGSVLKLFESRTLTRISDVASLILGARVIADTGEWGTYAWAEHVLGAPGMHLSGGTDQIQLNVAGERLLGLPREPKMR